VVIVLDCDAEVLLLAGTDSRDARTDRYRSLVLVAANTASDYQNRRQNQQAHDNGKTK